MNSGQDMELDDRLRRLGLCHWPSIEVAEITYLFRWSNGTYHLSGYGRDRPGAESGYVDIGRRVERALADGSEPVGEVELVPGFRHAYIAMARRFVEEHARGESERLRAQLEASA